MQKCTLGIAGETPPGRRDCAKAEDHLLLLAVAERPGEAGREKAGSQVVGQKGNCQPDHLSF